MQTYICIHIHTYTYPHTPTHTCIYPDTPTHTNIDIYRDIYKYTYLCIYTWA